MKTFNDHKLQVQQFIHMNLDKEVTTDTKYKVSGIYMIYINNFSSESVIPIYIGRAEDIQGRFKQHFEEILALNRLSSEEYKNYFFSKSTSFYEGKFKSCKIFKYMLENKCTLQDFRMLVLEEADKEFLVKKEQEYFQRFLPSFFGFNQFNSFLKQLEFRFRSSDIQINNDETREFLRILLEDVETISSYSKYGYTRFNFQQALPKGLFLALKERNLITPELLIDYNKIKFKMNKIEELYKLDIEENEIKSEIEAIENTIKSLEELRNNATREFNEAAGLLTNLVTERFKELNMYKNKIPINNFIRSILTAENEKYRNNFLKFLEIYQCDLDFYEIYSRDIERLKITSMDKDKKQNYYDESSVMHRKKLNEIINKRYKLIYPTPPFDAFSLGDMSKQLFIDINEEYDLLNTCHIQLHISNNAINRSMEIEKEPFIIRVDYCYIDNHGSKTEHEYYIDNKTTQNCLSGIEYFEQDFYNLYAFKKERFKIGGLINGKVDNSFISIQAEFKHGVNDYTLRDKNLIKLSIVLDEIKQLTNEETRYKINTAESANCLRNCILNEKLQNNEFVEQVLLAKKLLKLKKRKKLQIKKYKDEGNKINVAETDKDKRTEAYKQKVLMKSDNTIEVLNYVSSKEKVTAQCKTCGNSWDIRSDHLLNRLYCPRCRKSWKITTLKK